MAEKEHNTAGQADFISLDVAARLLMIGAERVRQLVKAGYIERPKPGRTTIVSAVQGYIRFLKDEGRKNTKTASASRATDARAAEIELRIAERKRQLIPTEDNNLVLTIFAAKVNEEMNGLPARVTRDLKLRKVLEADIHGSKTRIADALEDCKEFAATGRVANATGSAFGT